MRLVSSEILSLACCQDVFLETEVRCRRCGSNRTLPRLGVQKNLFVAVESFCYEALIGAFLDEFVRLNNRARGFRVLNRRQVSEPRLLAHSVYVHLPRPQAFYDIKRF